MAVTISTLVPNKIGMKMFSLIAKSVSQDNKLTFKLLIWVH